MKKLSHFHNWSVISFTFFFLFTSLDVSFLYHIVQILENGIFGLPYIIVLLETEFYH